MRRRGRSSTCSGAAAATAIRRVSDYFRELPDEADAALLRRGRSCSAGWTLRAHAAAPGRGRRAGPHDAGGRGRRRRSALGSGSRAAVGAAWGRCVGACPSIRRPAVAVRLVRGLEEQAQGELQFRTTSSSAYLPLGRCRRRRWPGRGRSVPRGASVGPGALEQPVEPLCRARASMSAGCFLAGLQHGVVEPLVGRADGVLVAGLDGVLRVDRRSSRRARSSDVAYSAARRGARTSRLPGRRTVPRRRRVTGGDDDAAAVDDWTEPSVSSVRGPPRVRAPRDAQLCGELALDHSGARRESAVDDALPDLLSGWSRNVVCASPGGVLFHVVPRPLLSAQQ